MNIIFEACVYMVATLRDRPLKAELVAKDGKVLLIYIDLARRHEHLIFARKVCPSAKNRSIFWQAFSILAAAT